MASKQGQLAELLATAREKGELYFQLLDEATFEFDRIERARLDALQAMKDFQSFAEASGLSGANLQAAGPKTGSEADAQRLRKNFEVASANLRA